jgi:hypothetical protein
VTLISSGGDGNQWYLDGNPIGGAINPTHVAVAAGAYTVVVTSSGCPSAASSATTVTVNPSPPAPTIIPGGPLSFCSGGSVTLTSSSASGNQWYLNENPIGGATAQQYIATATGSYTVVVTSGGCNSAPSAPASVFVAPLPATPTITPGGPTTFCQGGSVTLTSSSASGQWYRDGTPIGGATAQQYIATVSGSYTVTGSGDGCMSLQSAATVVTVNPIPPTPVITPGGPTTFCQGGSVTLTSSSANGNLWSPGGETTSSISVTASGNYSVTTTVAGCSSAPSAPTAVTVNPTPPTPTITPGGPTTFCNGGSVTLTSSSATGNQWFANGNPIGGATAQQFLTSTAGDYSVVVTGSGCSSTASPATTVTVNPNPVATITTNANATAGSTGNTASVASAGVGATYNWSITNGSITAGSGTSSVTFTAGAAGTLTLQVTVTTAAGCSDTKSAQVTLVSPIPPVTVTAVSPLSGPYFGGQPATITGTGFSAGATVTFGGTAATNVVVASSTSITATTPAHAVGAVNVTVTNVDTGTGTRLGGYTYNPQQFDPNGDNVVDASDIFYLVNYLFLNGTPPSGAAGLLSGDSNRDGVVDPADIFYLVAYLFTSGPRPFAVLGDDAADAASSQLRGAVTLGTPVMRNGRFVVPVSVESSNGADAAHAMALTVRFRGAASNVSVHRAGAATKAQPLFEISRSSGQSLTYLLQFAGNDELAASGTSRVVAEIELDAERGPLVIEVDSALTMLANRNGTASATVRNGALRVSGTRIGGDKTPKTPWSE